MRFYWFIGLSGVLQSLQLIDSCMRIVSTEDITSCYHHVDTSFSKAWGGLILHAAVNLDESL